MGVEVVYMDPNKPVLARKFVVKRSEWLRGNESNSVLRNDQGKMCCMGFYALACGYTKEQILGQLDLRSLAGSSADSAGLWGFHSSIMTYRTSAEGLGKGVYAWNDSETISEEEREAGITKVLAARGIEVAFED